MEYGLEVVGAYGTKCKKGGSSSFLIDSNHAIDAGNLLLGLENRSVELHTVWLTHSHLDHVNDLAFIIETYYAQRSTTLTIRGLPETLRVLKEHFFNDDIWPDFSLIPLINGEMVIAYDEIKLDHSYTLNKTYSITPFATDHTVPSCGYLIKNRIEQSSILLATDTYDTENIIALVASDDSIDAMVLECSFPSFMHQLARDSKHLTPELIFDAIAPLKGKEIKLYINHIKPNFEAEIHKEIEALKGDWNVTILMDGMVIPF